MSLRSARRLQEFLDEYCLTKAEFAKLAGISRASLYNYLGGDNVKEHTAKKIEENLIKNLRAFLPFEQLVI